MNYFVKKMKRAETGQTAVEYIIILLICAIGAVVLLTGVDNNLNDKISDVAADAVVADGIAGENLIVRDDMNIEFTLDGRPAEFKRGLTWAEWVAAHPDYSADKDGYVYNIEGERLYYIDIETLEPIYVKTTDVVSAGTEYYIETIETNPEVPRYTPGTQTYSVAIQGEGAGVSIVAIENTRTQFFAEGSIATVSAVVLPGHTFQGFYKSNGSEQTFVSMGILNGVDEYGDQEYMYSFTVKEDITFYAKAD